MAAEKDMTVGDPQKIILNFTIPVFIGNVFQQVYSMADTVIVGKFVGTKALAAVGATGTINFLILGFLLGLTAGFTVLTLISFAPMNCRVERRFSASFFAFLFSLLIHTSTQKIADA